jgi:hypothetical protein
VRQLRSIGFWEVERFVAHLIKHRTAHRTLPDFLDLLRIPRNSAGWQREFHLREAYFTLEMAISIIRQMTFVESVEGVFPTRTTNLAGIANPACRRGLAACCGSGWRRHSLGCRRKVFFEHCQSNLGLSIFKAAPDLGEQRLPEPRISGCTFPYRPREVFT